MFDSIHHHKIEHIHETKNIIIKNAPTDEHIKLYEELKEKAFKSIIHSIYVDDNFVKGSLVLFKDFYNYKTCLSYKFSINGKEFTDIVDISDIYTKKWNFEDSVREFYNKVSNKLTLLLFEESDKSNWYIINDTV